MDFLMLAVINFNIIRCHTLIINDLVHDFCKFKHAYLGSILTCYSKKERFDLLRDTNTEGLRLFVEDGNITDDKLDEVLSRKHFHYNHLCIVLDGDCNDASYIIEKTNNTHFFYDTHHWLIIVSSLEMVTLLLESAYLNINADVHIAIPYNQTLWSIYDAYNPASHHGGKLKVQLIGNYSKVLGYNAPQFGSKYWRRRDMTGVKFRSAVVIPYLDRDLQEYLNNDDDRQDNSLNRFQSVTVDHCRQMYNFSLHVQRTNSWGYVQKDTGRFDGLVSLLERRIVDFGSSPLVYKLDRMPVVDYSFGNWVLRSVFIYRRPRFEAKSYEIFLRPLATDVWLTICILLVFITLALKIAFSVERYLLSKIKRGVDPSWSFLVLFTLGAFCQQGATCYPRLFSSRILSVFVFLFCILVYQFYSASIVSYLLMDPPRSIFNLRDLLNSKLRAGIEDILIDRDYFVQTTDPVAIELFKTKINGETNDTGFYSPLEGMELVQKGGFALHVQTSSAYPIVEKLFTNEQICELEEIQMYRTQPMHTNLQKHSPFKEMMNYCMLKMVEDGKMDGLRKHWDARKPTCIDSAKKIIIHVNIKEFSCGLIVLSYGILLSLFFLVLECVAFRKNDIFRRPQ